MSALQDRGFSLVALSLQPSAPVTGAGPQSPTYGAPPWIRLDRQLGAHARVARRAPRRYATTLADALASRRRLVLASWLRAVSFAPRVIDHQSEHIHAHFAVGANVVAAYLAQLTGRPFSFTTHAVDLFARPLRLCESLGQARFVVTISHYNRAHLERTCGAGAAKAVVLRAGIDPAPFAVGPRAASERPIVLSVGRLVPKKGHHHLLVALADLHRRGRAFACQIVGDGPEWPALERDIARLDLAGCVTLIGPASQDTVRALLAAADVFALPCIIAPDGDRDGIPVSLMEAMAAELPVVSTTISGIPELVEHDRTGLLVPPGDTTALAAALERLLVDPGLRRAMGRLARERLTPEYDIETTADRLAALFRDAAPGPPSG
jgi:glycosyltransferase involved in cell wall biosynthesis